MWRLVTLLSLGLYQPLLGPLERSRPSHVVVPDNELPVLLWLVHRNHFPFDGAIDKPGIYKSGLFLGCRPSLPPPRARLRLCAGP